MTMRIALWAALSAAAGGLAAAQEQTAPVDPAIQKGVEAIEAATRNVLSLKSGYTREYTKYGRSGAVKEEGQFFWKRSPEGIVSARWEGKDESGPILTLIRDRKISVFRGAKKTSDGTLDEAHVLHPSRFGFPLLPRDWSTAYKVGGPRTSPEYDDRYPERSKSGIPSVLTLTPDASRRIYFSRLSLSFDEEAGLAWRFRCDTSGWTLMFVEIADWTLNPELPESLFEPPREAGTPEKETGKKDAKADPGKNGPAAVPAAGTPVRR
jgi:outer membrane lipoprotein-sorting protein